MWASARRRFVQRGIARNAIVMSCSGEKAPGH
jgi:hypothetical protein